MKKNESRRDKTDDIINNNDSPLLLTHYTAQRQHD